MPNPPRIQFKGREAYYHPKEDYINLPPFKSFISTDAYYSVLFHELIHSTGNEQRLNRKEVAEKIVFGSEDYSLEELTAEIGACFLKSFSGIPGNDMSQNAAYIQNWLTVLRNDKRFILKASSRAQKATEYILNWDTSDSNSAKEIEEQEFEIPEEF